MRSKIKEGKIINMKVLALNLPNPKRIIRRYMCSYHSPMFLFPPLELISAAAIVRTIEGVTAKLHDAIAEQTDIEEVCSIIRQGEFDAIFALSGFECFENDMQMLQHIREQFPKVKQVLFGYYPTEFPEQVLQNTEVDAVLLGEPEYAAHDLFSQWKNETSDYSAISGMAYRENGEIKIQKNSRITHLNELPIPAYDLLKIELYSEPFLPSPFGMMQSARGCPYKCNYCVRTYGTKLTALTPENMILHVKRYIELFNIKSLRFIDDTFTATPSRVVQFCKMLEENEIHLKWTCLSRADTLNKEMLYWMKRTGCVRLYIGVESGSQNMLDFYNKGMDKQLALENLLYCKKIGLETSAFFMVAGVNETEKDLQQSIDFAIEAKFDFVVVSEMQTYPGTIMYEDMKDKVEFSLFPYVNRFKDPAIGERQLLWQKKFYNRFYNRPGYILKKIPMAISHSKEVIKNFIRVNRFVTTKQNAEVRRDLL
jgi:anaerobic magnesium-protoporphyrin IX monomethyl ester cyclase